MSQAKYDAPTVTELGSLHELTLGAANGFPDSCDLAVGSVVGADPCSGEEGPGGITKP